MKPMKLIPFVLLSSIAACDRSVGNGSPHANRNTPTARTPADAASSGNARATNGGSAGDGGSAKPPTTSPAATRAADDEAAHSRLFGTWVAKDVDASMGEVKIRLTFRKGGPVQILAWSDLPFVGQVRDKEAAYEIHGNTLTSAALRGGTSVNYRFDGKDLLIEYKEGKTVRFTRE